MQRGHPKSVSTDFCISRPFCRLWRGTTGRKTLQLELPSSLPDKKPPWDGEKQPGSCQQPSRAVRRHQAHNEVQLLPFKERQRLRHLGTNPQFQQAPNRSMRPGTTLAMPDSPTAAHSHDGQPGQRSLSYRLHLGNPRAPPPTFLPSAAALTHARTTLSPPSEPAAPAPCREQAVGRMMLFSRSLHQATANASYQRPKHFAPLMQKVLPVQQRILPLPSPLLSTAGQRGERRGG